MQNAALGGKGFPQRGQNTFKLWLIDLIESAYCIDRWSESFVAEPILDRRPVPSNVEGAKRASGAGERPAKLRPPSARKHPRPRKVQLHERPKTQHLNTGKITWNKPPTHSESKNK